MHAYPHHYRTWARGGAEGSVDIGGPELPSLQSFPPPAFDGPPGFWSPETFLTAAVADCFILSFRAVAKASKFDWADLDVDVEGILDRVEGVTRFTRFVIRAKLSVVHAQDVGRAGAVLDKAKRVCLVSNSLNGECVLEEPEIAVAA